MSTRESSTEESNAIDAIIERLPGPLHPAAREITPEFVHSMPRAYFSGARIVRPQDHEQHALENE
jgi:hypothetical protein